jgi:phage-related minor tail protein
MKDGIVGWKDELIKMPPLLTETQEQTQSVATKVGMLSTNISTLSKNLKTLKLDLDHWSLQNIKVESELDKMNRQVEERLPKSLAKLPGATQQATGPMIEGFSAFAASVKLAAFEAIDSMQIDFSRGFDGIKSSLGQLTQAFSQSFGKWIVEASGVGKALGSIFGSFGGPLGKILGGGIGSLVGRGIGALFSGGGNRRRQPEGFRTAMLASLGGKTRAGHLRGIHGSLVGKVPGLAKGGVVRKPTLALIGEKGPERVEPLNRSSSGMSLTVNVFGSVGVEDIGEQLVRELKRRGIR